MQPLRGRRLAAWILGLALVWAVAFQLRDERELLRRLLDVSPAALGRMAFAWFLLSIPRGLMRRTLAKPLGVRLSFVDWYGLSMVTNLVSLVTPARADSLLAAGYLKAKYGLPLSRYAGLVYGTAVITALVLSVEGAFALGAIALTGGQSRPEIWGTIVLLGLGALMLATGGEHLVPWDGWFWRRVREAFRGWQAIRRERRVLSHAVGLAVMSTICFVFWTYAAFWAVGIKAGLAPVVFASVAAQLAAYLNLTPGNLGIREALVGFVTHALGLGFAEGVAATLLQRAVSTVLFLLVGGAFGLAVFREGGRRGPEAHT